MSPTPSLRRLHGEGAYHPPLSDPQFDAPAMERHTEVKFRAHRPAQKRMIRIGRGARVSISVGTEWRAGAAREQPRIVRGVRESRRFLCITETTWILEGPNVLDAQGEEGTQHGSALTTTIFLFANPLLGPRRLKFSGGVKNDTKHSGKPEGEDQWETKSTSSTSSSYLSPQENGHEPTLRLRGGCLKLPARQGSKRRLGDDDELPALVWWTAGGQIHHKPLTGKQLREWKRKSDGYDKGNKKRGWVGEFAFAMTSGRVGRESGAKKKKKKKKEKKKDGEDLESGGDQGEDGDGESGS